MFVGVETHRGRLLNDATALFCTCLWGGWNLRDETVPKTWATSSTHDVDIDLCL